MSRPASRLASRPSTGWIPVTMSTQSNRADGVDPLAPFRRFDGRVNWLRVGAAEQLRRDGRRLRPEVLEGLTWLENNGGVAYLAVAAQEVGEWAVRDTTKKSSDHATEWKL